MTPNLSDYDRIIVAFSGGKDSLACLLTLIEQGAIPAKIELWHHEIDGREGSTLMDWPVTPAYCRSVAKAFGVPIYFSWLTGGFEREMNRDNARKAPTMFERPSGVIGTAGGTTGKPSTRLKFPQVSADLKVRWCSPYLKIDVMDIAIKGQTRFNGIKTLVLTGERAEESPARAKYKVFEPHRADARNGNLARHIDHWRPVHGLTVVQVWEMIGRHRVNPHPVYRIGIGRVSCQFCIFANPNQLASARAVSPDRFQTLPAYEQKFGFTVHRKENMQQRADRGTPYPALPEDIAACQSKAFNEPIFLPADQWKLPSGAFAESCGPT